LPATDFCRDFVSITYFSLGYNYKDLFTSILFYLPSYDTELTFRKLLITPSPVSGFLKPLSARQDVQHSYCPLNEIKCE
jgi:hypothetical protein